MIPKVNRTMMHFVNGVFMVDYNNKVGNLYNSPPPPPLFSTPGRWPP